MPWFGPVTLSRSLFPILFLSAMPLLACDDGGKAKAAVEQKENAAEEEKKAAIAARRKKREDAQKAEEEAAAKVTEEISKLCVLPEKMPKKLGKACDAVATAQDGFMKRHFNTPELLKKWEAGKAMQLKMATDSCMSMASLEVAGCQANALEHAPVELKKKLPDLLRTCLEKFGPKGGKAPAIPAKKMAPPAKK